MDCGDRPICDEDDDNCGATSGGSCSEVICEEGEMIELGPCERCLCQCTGDGEGEGDELCCSEDLVWDPSQGACVEEDENPGCD